MNRYLSLILFLSAWTNAALVHAQNEQGMAAQLGPKSWAACSRFLAQPSAKVYELSQLRSPTMPLSPFAGPYQMKPKPTAAIPGTVHAFNSETINENAEPGQHPAQEPRHVAGAHAQRGADRIVARQEQSERSDGDEHQASEHVPAQIDGRRLRCAARVGVEAHAAPPAGITGNSR